MADSGKSLSLSFFLSGEITILPGFSVKIENLESFIPAGIRVNLRTWGGRNEAGEEAGLDGCDVRRDFGDEGGRIAGSVRLDGEIEGGRCFEAGLGTTGTEEQGSGGNGRDMGTRGMPDEAMRLVRGVRIDDKEFKGMPVAADEAESTGLGVRAHRHEHCRFCGGGKLEGDDPLGGQFGGRTIRGSVSLRDVTACCTGKVEGRLEMQRLESRVPGLADLLECFRHSVTGFGNDGIVIDPIEALEFVAVMMAP